MNCKAGDLAIIIKGPWGHSTSIGKIVKVLFLARSTHAFGPIWRVEFSSPVELSAASVKGEFLGTTGMALQTHAPDDCLRPIRPEEETPEVEATADQTQSEQLEAVA